MSRKRRGDTRRDILNAAEHLLQVQGFQGFSYQHIAARLGIRSAAVHYHFPAKVDLGVAVLRRFRDDFDWWRRQLDAKGIPAADRVEAFFELERRYAEQRKACPLGVVGIEYEGIPPAMRAEARALHEQVLGWLQDVLTEGIAEGSLCFEGDPEDVARQVLVAVQGALQSCRLLGEEGFRSVLRSLRATLGMERPPEPRRLAG